jgi:hypothetical protein
MAVQILTPGKEPQMVPTLTRRGRCLHCGCVIRVDRDSIRWEGSVPFIYCPTVLKKRRWWFDKKCGRRIVLYTEGFLC